MTIKAVIIDDEDSNVRNLGNLLEKHCSDVQVVATANGSLKGYNIIKEHKPELVFLDIEMPLKNGFELLEIIDRIDFEVIFVTAYDQYALKAIKFCALDYLLKPVDIFELKASVDKAKEKIGKRCENERMKMLAENTFNEKQSKKIALPTAEKIEFVTLSAIIYCQGENSYTQFFMTDGRKILVSRTLKDYEELLVDLDFLRVHQSYLINLNQIKSFVKSEGGYILMCDDTSISISRRRRDQVLEMLSRFRLG